VKASRQDVLQEALEELNAWQPLGAPCVGVAIFPAESHMGSIHAENPCVADRRPQDVTRQADAPPVRATPGAADCGIFSTRLNFGKESEILECRAMGA
jgi:hypothetical protein